MKYNITLIFCVTFLAIFLYSCNSVNDYPDNQQNISKLIFSESVTSFNVKVFYEPTAIPYTGVLALGHDTWDLTKQSYEALFRNHQGRVINTPATLEQMTAIKTQAVYSWTRNQLISLGDVVAVPFKNGNEINITVIFLNGTYQGQISVLGVHFPDYPYVFIFKDIIISVGGTDYDQKYVEQAVVVHEVGHAVGLVNDGVPMVMDHEDLSHLKHSDNSQCVMYWDVESSATVLTSLVNVIVGGSLNLFSADSLNDGQSYHP